MRRIPYSDPEFDGKQPVGYTDDEACEDVAGGARVHHYAERHVHAGERG